MPTCPKCDVSLERMRLNTIPVFSCPECCGELIERDHLQALERLFNPKWTDLQKDLFLEIADNANAVGTLSCSKCGQAMQKFNYPDADGPQVDCCRPCGIYWLDSGELEALQVLHRQTLEDLTLQQRSQKEALLRVYLALEKRRERFNIMEAEGHKSRLWELYFRFLLLVSPAAAAGHVVHEVAEFKDELEDIEEQTERILIGSSRPRAPGNVVLELLRKPAVWIALVAVAVAVAVATYLLMFR